MNQETALVVDIAEGGVWVESFQQSSCGGCQAKQGCGQHTLSQIGRPVRLWVETQERYELGETVTLSLPHGALAVSATVLYGAPLLGLVLGAVIGYQGGSDILSIVSGLGGLVIGFWLARKISNKQKDHWHPSIIRSS